MKLQGLLRSELPLAARDVIFSFVGTYAAAPDFQILRRYPVPNAFEPLWRLQLAGGISEPEYEDARAVMDRNV